MSTSTQLTRKVFLPKQFAKLLVMVPDEYTDLCGLRDWEQNNKLDFSKLSHLSFDIETFYGSDIAEFIQSHTDREWGSMTWEFGTNEAAYLLEAIEKELEEQKDEDFIEDLKHLNDVIEEELEAGTNCFEASVWY
ncbi:MAG: hypothetical protein ACP5D6_06365 [Kosmotogaceae bacterium]